MTNINYSLSRRVGEQLNRLGLTIGIAESCTGGGLARVLTSVRGASQYFDRGYVTYSNAAKQEILSVPADVLDKHGAVSKQAAIAMAQGVLANSHVGVAMAITGIAGPTGGSADKPVGTVWFAYADRQGETKVEQKLFAGGRKNVRYLSIEFALMFLFEELRAKVSV